MSGRLTVGVIGSGVIAQVMHLHYLQELQSEFDIAILCDLDAAFAANVAARHHIPRFTTDWREVIDSGVDCVLVLTSGDHAEVCIAALEEGVSVFVEKPMSLSMDNGQAIRQAAEASDATLMVGYPKRYDPAFDMFRAEVASMPRIAHLRVTTLESPFIPYTEHYSLIARAPQAGPPLGDLGVARGTDDWGSWVERVHRTVLLDSMVHEFNATRSLLGEPTSLDFVRLTDSGISVLLTFGPTPVTMNWIDLPGLTDYSMEFAAYATDKRARLTFPSPFLRNAPAAVEVTTGTPGRVQNSVARTISSYDSGFRRELEAFHHCVVARTPPLTDATDALRDMALCASVVESLETACPVEFPTALASD